MRFFSDRFVFLTGGNFDFFHAHIPRFQGWDLAENFAGTVDFSRAVSKKFSRAEIQKFSREGFFFPGEKKSTDRAGVGVEIPATFATTTYIPQ